MNKVVVVTGTRAEYGILKPLIKKIDTDSTMQLSLLVTGMHLSNEFGLTYKEIENDGFKIEQKIELLLSSDTKTAMAKSIGLGVISFSEAYDRIQPDLVILLGDRFEIFAAASAAMIIGIPIAHLHGGELTEGAVDDAIRHAITKMSYLHFTSTEAYRQRVIQLGEEPERVYNVGALGVENIKRLPLLSKQELESRIQFDMTSPTASVTFHPVTLENQSPQEQFEILLSVLDEYKQLRIIFTKANADAGGRIINEMIDDYVSKNKERCISFTSMGQINYLSSLKYCDLVIGNSSSGIIEVPSFKIPSINIGDRQKGRIVGKSVIQCECSSNDLKEAINKALSNSFKKQLTDSTNPYEKENTSENILNIIKQFLKDKPQSIKKQFYNLPIKEVEGE